MTRARGRPGRPFTVLQWMGLVAACAVAMAVLRAYPWLLAGLAAVVAVSGPPLCGVSRRRAGRPLGVVGGTVVGAFVLTLACVLLMACVWLLLPEQFFHVWIAAGLGPSALFGGLYGALLEAVGGVAARRLGDPGCRYDPRDDPALRPHLEGSPPSAGAPDR